MADTKVTLTFEMTDGSTQDVTFVVPGGADGEPGPAGDPGPAGPSAYDSYVATTSDDPVLTEEEWLASLEGTPGTPGTDGADGVGIVSVTATTAPVPPIASIAQMTGEDGLTGAAGDTVTGHLSVLPEDTTGPVYLFSDDETIVTVPVNTPVVEDTDGNGYNASFEATLVAEGSATVYAAATAEDAAAGTGTPIAVTVTAAA